MDDFGIAFYAKRAADGTVLVDVETTLFEILLPLSLANYCND